MNNSFLKNIFEHIRHKRLIVAGTVLFFVLGYLLFSSHGLVKRYNLERKKSELAKQIKMERRTRDSLKTRIHALTYDSLEIERIAREYYGMIKPGETIYYIKDKPE